MDLVVGQHVSDYVVALAMPLDGHLMGFGCLVGSEGRHPFTGLQGRHPVIASLAVVRHGVPPSDSYGGVLYGARIDVCTPPRSKQGGVGVLSLSWSVCVVEVVGWERVGLIFWKRWKMQKRKENVDPFCLDKIFFVTSRTLLPDNGHGNGGGSGRKLHD